MRLRLDYGRMTDASLVDGCRHPAMAAKQPIAQRSPTKQKPSFVTFCAWYIDASKAALYDTIAKRPMEAGVARWPESLVLLPDPDNIRVNDFYMMIYHRMKWVVCTMYHVSLGRGTVLLKSVQ